MADMTLTNDWKYVADTRLQQILRAMWKEVCQGFEATSVTRSAVIVTVKETVAMVAITIICGAVKDAMPNNH
jgi:hypothetical protein